MRENEPNEPQPDEDKYAIFYEYPPNLEAIRQAIRDMGVQDRLEVSYDDLAEQELI